MNTRRIKASEIEESRFYKMPKFIIHDELFNSLSSDAKILYMIMRDRNELSMKNRWIDHDGYVYIIYTRESMMKDVNLSNKTVIKAVKDLKKCGLIEEKRQGVNKPNLIYVLTLDIEAQWKCKISTSGGVNNTVLDVEKVHWNETKYKNTNNKIEQFKAMDSREWDFDEMERLERIYIDEKIKRNRPSD